MAKRKSEKPPRFEDALCELETIAKELESGTIGLDESLIKFEQGIALLRHCYRVLDDAEKKVSVLTGIDGEGKPILEPFDASATSDQGGAGRRKSNATSSESPSNDDVGNRERELF